MNDKAAGKFFHRREQIGNPFCLLGKPFNNPTLKEHDSDILSEYPFTLYIPTINIQYLLD